MSASGLSCPRTTKSGRPLGATANAIRDGVVRLTEQHDRMTVRGVFYALEVQGIVAKTEAGYRQVQQQVLRMRRDNLLSWDFIADGTRWQRKPDSWREVDDFIDHMAHSYRRDLWARQGIRIEVWLEKGALADLIYPVTERWNVPLMVSRGQSSATFLYSAAKEAERAWHDAHVQSHIFTMYDHDAGGQRAARTIERDLRAHAPGVPIIYRQLAVTEEQIVGWALPTRPAKRSDPEAHKFDGPAVELDAIPQAHLHELVEHAILGLLDPHAWQVEQAVEAEEQAGLEALLAGGEPR